MKEMIRGVFQITKIQSRRYPMGMLSYCIIKNTQTGKVIKDWFRAVQLKEDLLLKYFNWGV